MSAEASRALKAITGSSRFVVSGEEYTVERAASGLVESWPSPPPGPDTLCRIKTADDTGPVHVKADWGLRSGPPMRTTDPKYTVLQMGEQTLMGEGVAAVYFACLSERLDVKKVAHLGVSVDFLLGPKEVADAKGVLREPYVTVAHSLALALAKELQCEGNGGLPARPVLDPA